LLRIVRTPDGAVEIDRRGRLPGRGGYVHRTAACVDTALSSGGLARALRTGLRAEAAARLREQMIEVQETR
jgi:uncharacterized protein